MSANKSIAIMTLACVLVISSCAPKSVPTVQLESTTIPLKLETENKDDFVVRIASNFFIKRPLLIALSEMESKANLWQGVSPKIDDMEKCWIVEVDAVKQCDSENIRNFIGNPDALKIFFAPAYSSDSLGELYILDYHHPPAPYDTAEEEMKDRVDGYRLVLDFQEGKWVQKSLTQVY